MDNNNGRIQSLATGLEKDGPKAQEPVETRKMLTKNKAGIDRSNKMIIASIALAAITVLLLIVACIHLTISVGPKSENTGSGNSTESSGMDRRIKELNKTIDILKINRTNSNSVVTHFNSTFNTDAGTISTQFGEVDTKLDKLTNDSITLTSQLNTDKSKYREISNKEKCGNNIKVTSNVGEAKCSSSNPCYCYGAICLTEGQNECHKGKVYQSGKPVCNKLWDERGGKVTCTALGFYNVHTAKNETISSSDYFKTNCDGYEAELSTCTTPSTNNDCNNGHAYVTCNGIPELK